MKSQQALLHHIMRITFVLAFALVAATQLLCAANSFGQVLDKRIDLSYRRADAYTVIKDIQQKTGVDFAFTDNLGLDNITFTDVHYKNRRLEEVLKALLNTNWIAFREQSGTVILYKMQAPGRITGRITDTQGTPLSGASIKVREINRSYSADDDGHYSISLPPGTYTLEVTYIAFRSQQKGGIAVEEGKGVRADFTLDEEQGALSEVVVTALGIKREEKSLGYAAQTVTEEAVTEAKSNNWVNALSGKVAGLTVQGAGAGPMGSSRITLRGESSLNLDNNQALVVIDGVPVSNRITGTGFNSHLSQDSPIDFGSNVNDLNPDDIENITVLKGPAATALYGSRAAGGALIVTTKSASRKQNGIGITFNSNTSIEQINRWPDYQFEYGEGRTDEYYSYGATEDGPNTSMNVAAGRAWGPRFEGQQYYQYDPLNPGGIPTTRTPWVAYDDYISGFFQTGITTTNGLAIAGGNEDSGARLSVTHLTNKWILPNTGFNRINASLSVQQKVSERLRLSGKFNYAIKKSDNLPAAGYNNQTMMYFLIIGTTPNVRPEWFMPYWEAGREGVEQYKPFNAGPENPYAIMYEMLNKMNKHNIIGNVSATYKVTDNMDVMLRSGLDFAAEDRSQQRPFSMTKYPRGMYREQGITNYESNTDVLLSYRRQVSNALQLSLSAGGNYMFQSYKFYGMYADQLAQPGIYQLSNSLDPVVSEADQQRKAIASLYAFGQLSYQDKVFVDLTGRNDWSSTLPVAQRSFFYPSVNTSFVLNELLALPRAISFAKLRLSWAQVGNDTRPYQTARYYDQIYGNSLTNSSILYNPNLKPEITTSYEAGLDIRFLRGRIGADITAYTNDSRNQILATPVDPVSGYSSALINAGLINSKGIEVVLNGQPVMSQAFKWDLALNWSLNRSYVKELAEGITNQIIYSHSNNVNIEARVGGRMGDLYGRGFQRSPEGEIIYNISGLPESLDPEMKKWGNAFADWKAGLSNRFSYKSYGLSVLLDGQKGGSIYSQTNHKNNTLGKTKVTLPGRDEGIVGQGVVRQSDGSFVPNTTRVPAGTYYDNYYQISNAETNVFDASFLKIREVRLSYTLPPALSAKLRLTNASIALWGRDLFNFTSFPGFDPEGGNLNDGTLTPGVELTQFPSTRSLGMNITLGF
ncbi:TonB-linked outer membrane protein, SusC/RagA family [Parapedobacter luteus]|uniref:TonB-linked outer membrane protein, SusC/RagA family n=1 Tax=Parapedobacter luteus TaxID=623280 RepID=A0A1T5A0H6_9SPHI|nr:SusC/RagA family TonB-linked outer membrane protein [Parapedobacter luteus]SKB28426.1 TonB-linked outer membrane protein, SusC/RagA family [Parapedobacter luteus]